MATEYTPNYNLDLYASADKPNLRDQYNAAMGKVDAQMKKTADDVTNANANVLTMQTQVSKNKEDIAALESTVETHGVQITGAQKTADDALSLAQTNETDIAGTQADVTALTGRVSAVEGVASKNKADISTLNANVSQKAPTDHASSTTLYGQGNATEYGHVKVADSGSASAATGTAASPQMVSQVAGQVSSLTEQWGAAPATIGSAISAGCSVRAWGEGRHGGLFGRDSTRQREDADWRARGAVRASSRDDWPGGKLIEQRQQNGLFAGGHVGKRVHQHEYR